MTSLSEPGGVKRPEALIAIENVGLQEYIEHPFARGQLTEDGQQFSSLSTSGTAESVFSVVAAATVNPIHFAGELTELEFGLTTALRSDVGTAVVATVQYQWQGRSIELAQGTVRSTREFRNLHSEHSSVSDVGTAFAETTYSGRIDLNDELDRFPIELQLMIKSEALIDAVAKVKNSSYIRGVSSSLYRRKLE